MNPRVLEHLARLVPAGGWGQASLGRMCGFCRQRKAWQSLLALRMPEPRSSFTFV